MLRKKEKKKWKYVIQKLDIAKIDQTKSQDQFLNKIFFANVLKKINNNLEMQIYDLKAGICFLNYIF